MPQDVLPQERFRDRTSGPPPRPAGRHRRQALLRAALHPLSFPSPHTKGGLLQEITIDHRVTPRQVALAFLVRLTSLFTIPKASTRAHAEENAGAGDLQLSRANIARIQEAFPRPDRVHPLPVL